VERLMSDNPANDNLTAQLDALHTKLDYIVARQQFIEEFIDEMTPVGREAMGVAAVQFGELENKGYFALGNELLGTLDTVVQRLQNTGTLEPIGPMGLMAAARDEEVQRGLAVALMLLRELGHVGQGEPSRAMVTTSAPRRAAVVRRPRQQKATRAAPDACKPSARPAVSVEPVMWEGRKFTPKGFLMDAADWDRELGAKMAEALGITLTDEHWGVLEWARADYLETGASPNVRRVALGSGVGTRQMYTLFLKTPGKTTAMIAGIPKPAGCI
jgi:TusE/DsrC/DsvC family sulfur relay protein